MRFIFEKGRTCDANDLPIRIACNLRCIEDDRASLRNEKFRQRIDKFNRIICTNEIKTSKSSPTLDSDNQSQFMLTGRYSFHWHCAKHIVIGNRCLVFGRVVQEAMSLDSPHRRQIGIHITVSHGPKRLKGRIILWSENRSIKTRNVGNSNQFCIIQQFIYVAIRIRGGIEITFSIEGLSKLRMITTQRQIEVRQNMLHSMVDLFLLC